jgi:hypothetical protein
VPGSAVDVDVKEGWSKRCAGQADEFGVGGNFGGPSSTRRTGLCVSSLPFQSRSAVIAVSMGMIIAVDAGVWQAGVAERVYSDCCAIVKYV